MKNQSKLTLQEEDLIYWIEFYQYRCKEINKKLNKLKALAKKGKSNSEEALELKESAYFLGEYLEPTMDFIGIGTTYYKGLGIFFNSNYKYPLREGATQSQLKRVHDAFIKAGLPLDGESVKHEQIINKIVKTIK